MVQVQDLQCLVLQQTAFFRALFDFPSSGASRALYRSGPDRRPRGPLGPPYGVRPLQVALLAGVLPGPDDGVDAAHPDCGLEMHHVNFNEISVRSQQWLK